jgi:hypothetical protein
MRFLLRWWRFRYHFIESSAYEIVKPGLSVSEMIELDWRAANFKGEEVITQALSRAAFASGIEGLLLPSAARRRGGFNLLWFPSHLDAISTVSIVKGIP